MEIYKGVTRMTILVGNIAIKLPRLGNHLHFLQGCYSNYSERYFCKTFKEMENWTEKVAPSYWCSVFGLVQIQARCIVNTRELTDQELEFFKEVRNGETKPANFGFYRKKLVCLDYA